MKRRRGPYRNGQIHVLSEKCATCIFHPENRMHLDPGRLKQMVKLSLKRQTTAIFCHDTLDGDKAICRGFYDRYETVPLQLGKRMRIIQEVNPTVSKETRKETTK